MELTKFGVWVGAARWTRSRSTREAVALAQELGFGALWLGGSPRLPTLRPLLEATDRLVIATGIVNVWQYEPAELAAEFAELEADFPDRRAARHRHRPSRGDAANTRSRWRRCGVPRRDRRRGAAGSARADGGRCARPKMLDLSFERTLGTHPYFTPPAHTRFARERLGPARWSRPSWRSSIDDDQLRAKTPRASTPHATWSLSNYTSNLMRFGFTEERSAERRLRALIDEIVPQGSAAQLAAAVRRTSTQAPITSACSRSGRTGVPADQWRRAGAAR